MEEQLTLNQLVEGSSPPGVTLDAAVVNTAAPKSGGILPALAAGFLLLGAIGAIRCSPIIS